MKRLLIATNNFGKTYAYMVTYPENWTDYRIKQHFDSVTFGVHLDYIAKVDKVEEVEVNDMSEHAVKVTTETM